MAYQYDVDAMKTALKDLIDENLDDTSKNWLEKQHKKYIDSDMYRQGIALSQGYGNLHNPAYFNLTFTAIPRFVNKGTVVITNERKAALQKIRTGFDIANWDMERLVRTWWLLQLPVDDEEKYVEWLSNLFIAAEMREQVALYGSLPLLAYPKRFVAQASVGVRTNIGVVFDAIVLNNPFASEYMEDPAWNQLVLKAFFMERCVNDIVGLDERANQKLAHILSDYAHERRAAGRPVDPLLWRPVAPFIDDEIFPDIQKLLESGDERERKAAVLACSNSGYGPAKEILNVHTDLNEQVEKGGLSWRELECTH